MSKSHCRWLQRGALFGLIALAVNGAGATAMGANSVEDLNIHASGAWRQDKLSGTWEAALALNGNAVTGEIKLIDHPELGQGRVLGDAQGQSLTLTMTQADGSVATLSGSFTDSSLIGKYETRSGATGTWAGSWNARAPRIADRWSADVQLTEPVLVEPPPARPSGIKQMSQARILAGNSVAENGRQWLKRVVGALGDGALARMVDHFIDAAFAAVTVGSNVLVNNSSDSGSAQNEPEVAVDRINNPNKMAAGSNDYSFASLPKNGYYFSGDGGATWPNRGQIPGLSSYDEGGDPALDFDAGGRVFYAGIAFNSIANTSNAVFVARALAGQTSYQNPVLVATSSDQDTAFHDKPWLAVNRFSGSPGYGNIYMCWTKWWFRFNHYQILLARSTDQGATFNAGVEVSDNDLHSTGCSVAVAPNGDVNVVWLAYGHQIMMGTCTNGGTSCGADQLIANITPLPENLPNTTFPVNSFPTLAIDAGQYGNGYKAIVWADYRNLNNADIYFTLYNPSTMSWLTPKAIASAATDEFFPTITIDTNSFQQVLYYQRTSQSANTFNAFIIQSGNGNGNFSAPTKVNDGGNISPTNQFDPNFIGDYLGIDATTTRQTVWMDSRRTIPGSSNHQQDIYTATVSGC